MILNKVNLLKISQNDLIFLFNEALKKILMKINNLILNSKNLNNKDMLINLSVKGLTDINQMMNLMQQYQ